MNKQTQDLVNQLETRIEELTQSLAEANNQLQHRSAQLEASAQISRVSSSSAKVNSLSKQIAKIIKDGFELYHVGVYLIDHSSRWAVLVEAAGKASRILKKEGRRLALDDQTIIAQACHHRKPYSFRTPESKYGRHSTAPDFRPLFVPKARFELALPLITNNRVIGALDVQSLEEGAVTEDDIFVLQNLADQIASAIDRAQLHSKTIIERDQVKSLYEISAAISTELEFDSIISKAVGLSDHLGATSGEIHLLADTGEIYFKSSYPERNNLDDIERKTLVRRTLAEGLDAWALKTGQPALVRDTKTDDRWLDIEHKNQKTSVRSAICVSILIGRGRLRGAISYVHPEPDQFDEHDLAFLQALTPHIAVALENTALLKDFESSLQESQLMLDVGRQLAEANSLKDVFAAFVRGAMTTGVERCVLYKSDEIDDNNVPQYNEVVFVDDIDPSLKSENLGYRFQVVHYPTLAEVIRNLEPLFIGDVRADERLNRDEQEFLSKFGTRSLVVIPLVTRGQVFGLISFEYRTPHNFTERELDTYRALCNQAILAVENALQIERTEAALAETQSLYRAGRVLAGAADLQEILEESLIEFLHSLGLDQGGITLLTADRNYGQLMAYVEKGQILDVERLRFPIDDSMAYQELLLSGQPFVSHDAANDPRLAGFQSFNSEEITKALLEAPMIIGGVTIGWIGADAVKEDRTFSQREIDQARAMADQIAIAIQNRRLLEQTQRRADQLKAVATVGEAVSGLIDLNELLNNTVNLIRDNFGFYHVSIFLTDRPRKWAVVRASTGEVGKIMVERPHRLEVGGQSIVGFVTAKAKPRIALDVGKDAVHFDNPLLPDTRSEMALPLISRGTVTGALDVQSVEAGAFSNEDVKILQIMADQLAAAIENASLFEQTQRRLMEQAMLYSIGTKINATLDLHEAADTLVAATADALDVAECALTLLEEGDSAYVISNYVRPNSPFGTRQGQRFKSSESSIISKIITAKHEFIVHIDTLTEDAHDLEVEYLTTHNGTALAIVPVLLRDSVIALLEVYDNKPHRVITEEDIVLLDSIALQASSAIENARLFNETQRRLEEQTALREASAIFSSTLNLESVLSHIAEQMGRAVDATSVYICSFEPETETSTVLAEYYGPYANEREQISDLGTTFYLPNDFPNTLEYLRIGRPQLLHADDTGLSEPERTHMETYGAQSILDIPLQIGGQSVAYAELWESRQRREFSTEEITLCQDLAQQAAIALQNARLFESARESQAFMKAVINEIPDPIFIKDNDHNWVVANKAFSEGILGLPEESVIGFNDYDYLPRDKADQFWDQDEEMFSSNQIQIAEETISDSEGNERILYTRKIPLTLRAEQDKPDYLIGIINDITERKHREIERERLIEETRRALERTQSFYRISNALATATDEHKIFETAVGEYLHLLNLKQGSLILLDKAAEHSRICALVIDDQSVEPNLILPNNNDQIIQHLLKSPEPLLIEDINNHSLTKDSPEIRNSPVEAMLFIPLIIRSKVVGMISVDSTEKRMSFSRSDIEIGEVIADQLSIWLENKQLLGEARHRSNLLQTAAEVSKAASSILDVDQLINTSVNVIRDQFDFYYVGLFLVDEARDWAVLGAGTGQAGRIQLEKEHRLKIGGESMIGWSIQHRQARIALNVGEEKVHFQNPDLPDTQSEMALPLISRDEVMGALTVQSVEQGAFTQEDITVLQTMADQLANAIANARFFAQTQSALAETELLYSITQEFLSADDEQEIYQIAMGAIIRSSIDSSAIYTYVGDAKTDRPIELKATWSANGDPVYPIGTRFSTSEMVIEQLIPRHEPLFIEDIESDPRLTSQTRGTLAATKAKSFLALPLSTYQKRLGFLLIAYNSKDRAFTQQQFRYYNTIAQQMVAALASLKLLEESQRQAKREEIIREVTSKIRSSVDVEDILKTTVTELSKVLGSSSGGITLNVGSSTEQIGYQGINGESRDDEH